MNKLVDDLFLHKRSEKRDIIRHKWHTLLETKAGPAPETNRNWVHAYCASSFTFRIAKECN